MRSDDEKLRRVITRIVSIGAGLALGWALWGCTQWAVPGASTTLRPCVGRYVSPDSAGVCAPGEGR